MQYDLFLIISLKVQEYDWFHDVFRTLLFHRSTSWLSITSSWRTERSRREIGRSWPGDDSACLWPSRYCAASKLPSHIFHMQSFTFLNVNLPLSWRNMLLNVRTLSKNNRLPLYLHCYWNTTWDTFATFLKDISSANQTKCLFVVFYTLWSEIDVGVCVCG